MYTLHDYQENVCLVFVRFDNFSQEIKSSLQGQINGKTLVQSLLLIPALIFVYISNICDFFFDN